MVCTGVKQHGTGFREQPNNGVQILWVGGNHWVLVLRYDRQVLCLDSLTSTRNVHRDAQKLCQTLFPNDAVQTLRVQQQEGGNDCGLFALALAEAACRVLSVHGDIDDLKELSFEQDRMRTHLVQCFTQEEPVLTPFPLECEVNFTLGR